MYLEKSVKIPIYRGYLVLVLSDNIDNVKDKIYDFDSHEVYAHSILSNYKGMEGYYMILNPSDIKAKSIHGLIAHEAVHIANMLAESRGFIADLSNDEPIAYLVEWIVNNVIEMIKKLNININK